MNHEELGNVSRLFFPDKGCCTFLCAGTCETAEAELRQTQPYLPPSAAALVFQYKTGRGSSNWLYQNSISSQSGSLFSQVNTWGPWKNPTEETQLIKSAVQRGDDGFKFFHLGHLGCFLWHPALLDSEVFSAWGSPSHHESGNVQVQALSFINHRESVTSWWHMGQFWCFAGSFTNQTPAEGWLRVLLCRFGLTNWIETSFTEVSFGRRTWNVCPLSQRSLWTRCGSV